MLYLSTRNTTDCYTAYRALNESQAPDGGFFVHILQKRRNRLNLKAI